MVPTALIALGLVPSAAGVVRIAELAGNTAITQENARFFAAPFPVVLHIISAVIFSEVGALQFSRGFRERFRSWHQTAGQVLMACGLLAALSGLWMTQWYPRPPGDGRMVYIERLVFGFAMLGAMLMSVQAIRHRNFQEHGDWILRAYAIGLGAGTQVLTHLPWFLLLEQRPGEVARGVMMGAGWVINVVAAECVIRKRRTLKRHLSTKSNAKPATIRAM